MGKVYTASVLQTPNPRVGLMSMGEEETKGSDLTREVHEVLKASPLHFVGNVEGVDIVPAAGAGAATFGADGPCAYAEAAHRTIASSATPAWPPRLAGTGFGSAGR